MSQLLKVALTLLAVSNSQLLLTKKAPELSVEGQLDAEKLREFLRTAHEKP
jgi:hypothetical protein